MKTTELAGGTVTREGEGKWRVNAPDGRHVGTFRTKKQALEKAEAWDKWDALASVQDIALALMPFTTTTMMSMLGSIENGELKYIPTDEDLDKAITLDAIYHILLSILRPKHSAN